MSINEQLRQVEEEVEILRAKLSRTTDALKGAKSALSAASGNLNPGFEPVEIEIQNAIANLESLGV